MIALGEAECCALAGRDCRPTPLRRRASRPQLKRDPLGSVTAHMTTHGVIPRLSLPVAAAVLVLGCHSDRGQNAALRRGAAAVCDSRSPLVVWLRPDGQYALNSAPMDSAGFVRTLRSLLPERPPSARVVMVQVAPTRTTELSWLVPLIVQSGGVAYEPDSACSVNVPSSSTGPIRSRT